MPAPVAETGKPAYLALGGNVGDVRAAMAKAIARLDARDDTDVTAISSLYRTPPWGDTDQPPFLNAAIAIATELEPHHLLDTVKQIEKDLKRTKTRRWGPRTIDIDILVYADRAFADARLELPHPRLTERGFVLRPLADITADLEIAGEPVMAWLKRADQTGIEPVAGKRDWWRLPAEDHAPADRCE